MLMGAGGVAKLADFGLTAITSDRGSSSYTATDDSSRPERWLAPECLEGGQGDEKADVYSFGMLLFEIFAKAVRPHLVATAAPSAPCFAAPHVFQLQVIAPRLDEAQNHKQCRVQPSRDYGSVQCSACSL